MESIDYKGHKIKAIPYQLDKSKRRALEFQIFSPNGNNILSKTFSGLILTKPKEKQHSIA